MPKILLTGGSGFLGTALLKHPAFSDVLVIGRNPPKTKGRFLTRHLDSSSDYADVLSEIDIVVHVAAKAHVMYETSNNPLLDYQNINTLATLNLAKQAVKAGVKRFIFLSSIKVLGEKTKQGCPFNSDDPFNPQDPYGLSKAEAEIGLQQLAKESNMELVVIRPPLVYGEGVKGNFAKLLKLTALRIPLPLGSIKNKRSLVGVGNLVDLICTCLEHEKAKNQTFLISDDHDFSTPDLLAMISKSGRYKSRLFKVPTRLISTIFLCMGKSSIYERLNGTMQVDITRTKAMLNWTPPYTPEECMEGCWFESE
jgi:nucleoside-diphosphate-sugar epimerase